MRTHNTIKNALIGTSMQILSMAFSFITRAAFARVLTVEYLGLESVFADIINMLSIAEMGFATAITYSLYKPIKDKDFTKINSIMKLFKKVYESIGCFIFIVGVILAPFIPKIISNIPTVKENIVFVFVLFLINSVIGYFFSFKQTLIIANQQDYLVQVVSKVFTMISNVVQILSLLIFESFILYLFVKIISGLVINIYLSKQADRLFPYLNLKNAIPLDTIELKAIRKNIGAMFFHKIGYRIVFSTDNIFISIFSTVANAGRFSNYDLISRSVALLLDMVLNSSTASVGNLIAEGDKEKSEAIFHHLFFLNFLLYSFSTSILLIIFNDFITLWIGQDYQLSNIAVFLITTNFFIHGMRRTVIIFRDSWGLFYKDRYKPILEIISNIFLQIILGQLWGLNGVLVGTSLSILSTSFWIEPLVLFKYGFGKNLTIYFKNYFRYFVKMIIFVFLAYFSISHYPVEGIGGLILKLFMALLMTITLMVILLYKEASFNYYLNLFKNINNRRKK